MEKNPIIEEENKKQVAIEEDEQPRELITEEVQTSKRNISQQIRDEQQLTKIEKQRHKKHLKQFIRQRRIFPMEVANMKQMTPEYHQKFIEALGFKVIKAYEGIWDVEYPKKWKLVPAPLSVFWVYLLDEYGRKRGAIHYRHLKHETKDGKKYNSYTFYINYMTFYRIAVKHVEPMSIGNKQMQLKHVGSPLYGIVLDAFDKTVYQTSVVPFDTQIENIEAHAIEERVIREKLYNQCLTWLNEHYPEHNLLSSYWE